MAVVKMKKLRVLVTDEIDRKGLQALSDHPGIDLRWEIHPAPAKLTQALKETEVWLVRSETKVTADWIAKAKNLRLIGRAGVGIDNIDVEAATSRGIAVVNAPSANTLAACEHAFAMMLALSRNIPQADADVKAGNWKRSRWMGTELAGKTLGLIGLGRIGREMAKRASPFDMKVKAFDPFVSAEQGRQIGVEMRSLSELLSECDFVSLHASSSPKTRHLLNRETLKLLKPGARIINCARGELIDEAALCEALESGRLAGAALDVFSAEPLPADSPLRSFSQVILTPHLGASTTEAQSRVAVEIGTTVLAFHEFGLAVNAINLPGFDGETIKSAGELLALAEKLGRFVGQIIDSGLKELNFSFEGIFVAAQIRPLAVSALKGVLSSILSEGVSHVNAQAAAAARGIKISEALEPSRGGYQQIVTVTAVTDKGPISASGAVISPGEPRLVRFSGLSVEARLTGTMIVLTNRDKPGVIGRVGLTLGQEGVNIADMRVGRKSANGTAVMILTVDGPVSENLLRKLSKIAGVSSVKTVKL
jgi:D-3-phosphoglycerate dehydrogenase